MKSQAWALPLLLLIGCSRPAPVIEESPEHRQKYVLRSELDSLQERFDALLAEYQDKSTDDTVVMLQQEIDLLREEAKAPHAASYPIVIESELYGGVDLEAKLLRAAASMSDDLDAVKVYEWSCKIWRQYMDGQEPSGLDLLLSLRSHRVSIDCVGEQFKLTIQSKNGQSPRRVSLSSNQQDVDKADLPITIASSLFGTIDEQLFSACASLPNATDGRNLFLYGQNKIYEMRDSMKPMGPEIKFVKTAGITMQTDGEEVRIVISPIHHGKP